MGIVGVGSMGVRSTGVGSTGAGSTGAGSTGYGEHVCACSALTDAAEHVLCAQMGQSLNASFFKKSLSFFKDRTSLFLVAPFSRSSFKPAFPEES